MMGKIGFSDHWRGLNLDYISTPQFSVIVNGLPKGLIIPQRGLRQGCPLFSYLFLLCAEGLWSLITHSEGKGALIGFGCYLQFPDNSLIFCSANAQNNFSVKEILQCYESVFKQMINLDKY